VVRFAILPSSSKQASGSDGGSANINLAASGNIGQASARDLQQLNDRTTHTQTDNDVQRDSHSQTAQRVCCWPTDCRSQRAKPVPTGPWCRMAKRF
jgi:hypothetical protein